MKIENVKYMLMAQDMDRAVCFYRDVIGLEPKMVSPFWSELTHGDSIVALHGGGNGEFQETGLSFQVEDLNSAAEEVKAGGGKVIREPEDRPGEPIRLAEFADTEGNGFDLTEAV